MLRPEAGQAAQPAGGTDAALGRSLTRGEPCTPQDSPRHRPPWNPTVSGTCANVSKPADSPSTASPGWGSGQYQEDVRVLTRGLAQPYRVGGRRPKPSWHLPQTATSSRARSPMGIGDRWGWRCLCTPAVLCWGLRPPQPPRLKQGHCTGQDLEGAKGQGWAEGNAFPRDHTEQGLSARSPCCQHEVLAARHLLGE